MPGNDLTQPQLAMLASLLERQAHSKDRAIPLKTWQGRTAAILARRGLVALDLHKSTLRQVAWLTATGAKLATDAAALTVQSIIG